MKIVMQSVMSDGKKINLNPGDPVDTDDKKCPIDSDEAHRLIDVGGARLQTAAEAEAQLAAAGPRTDGPTVAEWVKSGYAASAYPPKGYTSKSTDEEIAAAVAAEKAAAKN
jgi:hypothetical protein